MQIRSNKQARTIKVKVEREKQIALCGRNEFLEYDEVIALWTE